MVRLTLNFDINDSTKADELIAAWKHMTQVLTPHVEKVTNMDTQSQIALFDRWDRDPVIRKVATAIAKKVDGPYGEGESIVYISAAIAAIEALKDKS